MSIFGTGGYVPLDSSFIAGASYNPWTGTLVVYMRSGENYPYQASYSVFLGLITASSPGSYYNNNIKGR